MDPGINGACPLLKRTNDYREKFEVNFGPLEIQKIDESRGPQRVPLFQQFGSASNQDKLRTNKMDKTITKNWRLD